MRYTNNGSQCPGAIVVRLQHSIRYVWQRSLQQLANMSQGVADPSEDTVHVWINSKSCATARSFFKQMQRQAQSTKLYTFRCQPLQRLACGLADSTRPFRYWCCSGTLPLSSHTGAAPHSHDESGRGQRKDGEVNLNPTAYPDVRVRASQLLLDAMVNACEPKTRCNQAITSLR